MHKKFWFAAPVMILLLLGVLLLALPTTISAKKIDPPTPGLADGDWQWDNPDVIGETSPIDLVSAPKPEWLDVMSWDAITISGPATLCHPFRGGQFGWVGDIHVFTGKSWEPISTTMEWVPDLEGTYMACAKAPSAGTYALFGGYVKPANAGLPECDFPVSLLFFQVSDAAQPATPSGPLPFQLVAAVMDEDHQPAVGTLAKYTLSNVVPADSMMGEMKGTTTFQLHPEYNYDYPLAVFSEVVYIDINELESFTVVFTSMGCFVRLDASDRSN